jgi:hypothetical protein
VIDTAEQTTTECLACGAPIIQLSGRGHRKRLYCDDRCRQKVHRQRTQKQEQETSEARIAALELEVQRLQERLRIEERYRTDTQVRHFKSWLRRRRLPQDADFLKLFLDDTRLPHHASRSMYIARLKQYGYTAEDIALFEESWKDMLFNQS